MSNRYGELLKDPRWQKKRLEIMNRDKWTCQLCGDTGTTLNIHHMWYGKEPWDVPSNLLITLCEPCHKKEESAPVNVTKVLKAFNEHGLLASDVIELTIVAFEKTQGPTGSTRAKFLKIVESVKAMK